MSQRRLPDGSLFLPAQLIDGERPYGSLTEARLGSYWNLVAPYALASGLIRPESAEARGALRYLLRHGSRLVGVVRAGAYALYPDPVFPTGGTDQVYGINVARFLADNDEADQLVLSLYGTLAVAMTPETYVSGEAASVTPLGGLYHRAMYLPPNGASNAAFLTTLRSMLVHETREPDGAPRGLELAFATPRPWLRAGQADRGRADADELRPGLVRARGSRRQLAGHRRAARAPARDGEAPPAPAPRASGSAPSRVGGRPVRPGRRARRSTSRASAARSRSSPRCGAGGCGRSRSPLRGRPRRDRRRAGSSSATALTTAAKAGRTYCSRRRTARATTRRSPSSSRRTDVASPGRRTRPTGATCRRGGSSPSSTPTRAAASSPPTRGATRGTSTTSRACRRSWSGPCPG